MQGYFDPEKLTLYQSLLTEKLTFSECTYDFTRCVRPNGTAYGTGGTCRKGVESAAEEKPKRGRPKKVRKLLIEMTLAEKREELDRRVRESVRSLRKGDPEKLKADWVAEHNKGKSPDRYPSSLQMARDLATKRVKEEAKKELGSTVEKPKGKKPPLETSIEEIGSLYDKLAALKKQNLPSGERWRIDEVEEELRKAKRQALDEAAKLGDNKKAAFEKVDDTVFEGIARSRTQDELHSMISRLQYDYITSRDNPEEKEVADRIAKQLEKLADRVQDTSLRALYYDNIGRATGKIKDPNPGSLRETQSAAVKFLREYDEGLRSTTSIIRRANALEATLRAKIELIKSGEDRNPGWMKRRIRMSDALMKLALRRSNAEQRLEAKMKGIREKMLDTTLSEQDLFRLVNKISVTSPPGARKPTAQEVAETRKQVEEFARMFNGKGLTQTRDEKDTVRQGLGQIGLDPSQRAYAHSNTGYILTTGNKQTLFHEIGHIVEAQRPWLVDHAERWRNTRAYGVARAHSDPETQVLVGGGSEPAISHSSQKLSPTNQEVPIYKLGEMYPFRNRRYREDEIAVVDRYMSPYLGKIYTDRLTEVISSTTEFFAEPKLMAYLYKKHPDLFALGVGFSQT